MLHQISKVLKPADQKYAEAMAAEFLDESKLAELEKFPRWQNLDPRDPARVNPDGTIREA